MKTILAFTAFLMVTSAVHLHAASFTEAEFTRLHNEVKILKSDVPPRAAVVGEQIGAVTSVATGADSRAEMRFPDKSLTRLGANSRFTLRGDQRTLELDEGVMLLQVPKKLGGAKVRTAAVTAAVTGTTVLFEYVKKGFVKLIVIEGSVDLYFNDRPGVFKTAHAGEMIIMQVNSRIIPDPVDVDLNLLLKTSKLISLNDLGTPNLKQVTQAVKDQKKKLKSGDLVKTNLIIPGRGTQVALMTQIRSELPFQIVQVVKPLPPPTTGGKGKPKPNNNGPATTPPPVITPPTVATLSPLISGTTVLNETSEVRTNPHVDAFNSLRGFVTSEGIVYTGNVPYPKFAFGSNEALANPEVQPMLTANGPWAAFKFENLLINGTPAFNIPGSDIRNVILSSVNDVRLTEDNTYGTAAGGGSVESFENGLRLARDTLDNLVIYSQYGSILLAYGFGIYGENTNVSLVAASPTSDVTIQGELNLGFFSGDGYAPGGNLQISAGRDVTTSDTEVNAGSISAYAGRNITIEETSVNADKRAVFEAKGTLTVDDSSTLRVLSNDPDALLRLASNEGDVVVTGNGLNTNLEGKTIDIESFRGSVTMNGVINGLSEVFKARTLGDQGWINIGNSNLTASQVMKLYAEGNNGGVRFTASSSLDSPSIHINGNTVEIVGGAEVDVKRGGTSLNVYTNNAHFNTAGRGSFTTGGAPLTVTPKPFKGAGRPQY